MGLCFQPLGTALLNDFWKFAVYFHGDVSRKMFDLGKQRFVAGGYADFFHAALQIRNPSKKKKHIWLFSAGASNTQEER